MEIDTNCFLKFFKKGGGSTEPGHAPILPRFYTLLDTLPFFCVWLAGYAS